MAEIKIIKFTQDEFIFNNDIFSACEEIFLSKFPLEDYFDISDYSDLTFWVACLDEKMIGFGSLQTGFFYVLETIFIDEFVRGQYQIDLCKHILSECNSDKTVWVYQALESDYRFYLEQGFTLYKDYGQFFDEGLDRTRYILELKYLN
jgi:hypothetical protein